MTDKKISDEQLEKEILDGKTQKQIAHEYGYGYPSATLSQRCRKIGYQKLNKLNLMSHGGATLSLKSKTVRQIRKRNKIMKDQNIYYTTEIRDNGDVILKFSEEEWVEKQ